MKMAPRSETSAESAARFLKTRAGKRMVSRDRSLRLSRLPAAPPENVVHPRISVDFAVPTLQLIHDVLLDAIHAGIEFGDRSALLLTAESMVAQALGMPPSEDPPLSGRQGSR